MTEVSKTPEVETQEVQRRISPERFKQDMVSRTTEEIMLRWQAHRESQRPDTGVRAQGEFPIVPAASKEELIAQANQQRQEILGYEQEQEVEELQSVCEAVGIPCLDQMAEAVRTTMEESDAPFSEIVNKPPGETVTFPDEMIQDALKFSANYDATNALINLITAGQGPLPLVNENTYVADVDSKDTVIITQPDSVPSGEYERIKTIKGDSWGTKFSTTYDDRGAVVDQEGQINDIMVAKNMVALAAADQVMELGEHLGIAEPEVRELFFLETIGDYKALLSLVKTSCEAIQGKDEEPLEPGLPLFSQLSQEQKQLLLTAIFAAHGGWKAGVEDRALIEALRDAAKSANSADMESKTIEGIAASWIGKRMGNEKAFSYFREMLNAKGWPEVAKDVFQVAQGLIILKVKETEAAG